MAKVSIRKWVHERALRIKYGDKISSFQNLPVKDNSASRHLRNLQLLATKIFKVYNNMATEILNHLCKLVTMPYKLRNPDNFERYKLYFIDDREFGILCQIKKHEKFKIKKWILQVSPCT